MCLTAARVSVAVKNCRAGGIRVWKARMTIRKKVILILGGTFACLIAVLYFASREILLKSYLALEQSRGREDVREACSFFDEELTQMDMTVNDYASWNDTYAFVSRPAENQQYVKSNMIDETFKNQKLNLFIFVDPGGGIVYGRAFDYVENKEIPVPDALRSHLGAGSPLRLGSEPESSLTGIILMPEAPMLVAARHILTSEGKGPSHGVLIMGRYYRVGKKKPRGGMILEELITYRADDPRLPAGIRAAAGLLTPRDPVLVRPLNGTTLAGYAVKSDIYGKPAIYLKIRLARDIYRKGRQSILWFVLALAGVGVVVGTMTVVLLQRQVLSRLTRLSTALAGIGESGDLSGRVPVKGADELAVFARTINRMLGALQKTQTDLWESETRYRSIVENTRDVIMITRPDGIISYLSPSSRELFGYAPEELAGRRSQVRHPDDGAKVDRSFAEAIKGGNGSTLEYRIVTKDREVKWISHSWSPVFSDGALRMVVSVVRDITERRKMEEELIKAQKLETLGVLAGGIAHDFNNILTAVWGYLSLAKAAARPMDKVVELLNEAEKAASRARDLTQQLLTFSKGGTPVKKPLALEAVLKDAAGFALSGSNVRCEMDVPENLWLVEADEGQVNQVINNLVLNAVQAMPQGGVVRISAQNVGAGTAGQVPLAGKDCVMFRIRDEGIGIPEDHLQKIFDPYFTTKQRGSGLGLSITYSIVRNHNGAITVNSTLGEGTTFCVYLPASAEPAALKPRGIEDSPRGTGRILLMDDDEVVRAVVGRMLHHIGYEVAHAEDGGEMLAAYEQAMTEKKPFDVVIMDLTIPGRMGGREAIGKLLALDPRARAIVSSGYSNDPVAANFAHHGFKGFVPKPYRVEDLAAELKRVMAGGDSGGRPAGGAG